MGYLDAEALAVALAMLRDGECSLSEAAKLAGISMPALCYWCRREAIDWRKARAGWLGRRWLQRHGQRPLRVRRAGLRRLAAEAKAQWDREQAARLADVSPVRSTAEAQSGLEGSSQAERSANGQG